MTGMERSDSLGTGTEAAAPRPKFSEAIGFILQTVWKHAGACVAIVGASVVVAGLTNVAVRAASRLADPVSVDASNLEELGLAVVIGLAAAGIASVFVHPFTLGALSLLGSASVYDDEIDVRGIIRRTRQRWLDAVAPFLLTLLILAAIPLLLGVIANAVPHGSRLTLIAFALPVLAIPSVYVFVRLSLAIPVVMREGRGPIESLQRSWQLVHGGWWWVFTILLVTVLLGQLVGEGLSSLVTRTIDPDGAMEFVAGGITGAISFGVSITLFGVGAGVAYSSRAPEDIENPAPVTSDTN